MNAEEIRAEEFPLYPLLSEDGKQEAKELVDAFKKKLAKAAEDVLGELYCNVLVNIESDSWTNYRNKLMAGFRNYGNRNKQGSYDFKAIRAEIFKDFREEIIKDLNQDLVAENEELKKKLEAAYERYDKYCSSRY